MSRHKVLGYYEIKYPIKNDFQKKTWWMRIGSATKIDTEQILCHIDALPLNWNGEFQLFPAKKREPSDE